MTEINLYGVKQEDFKELEDIFRLALNGINMEEDTTKVLEDFIIDVGVKTKDILQKYHTDNRIKGLEVQQHQEDLMAMKRKMVKMQLKFKNIENAINAFNNVK